MLNFQPHTTRRGIARSSKISSVELTQSYLERITRLNPQLNAFITLNTGNLAGAGSVRLMPA